MSYDTKQEKGSYVNGTVRAVQRLHMWKAAVAQRSEKRKTAVNMN